MTLEEALMRDGLTDRDCLQALRRAAIHKTLPKNRCISAQGIVDRDIYVVTRGITRIAYSKEDVEDNTLLFGSDKSEVYVSMSGFRCSEPSVFSFWSVTEVEYYVLPYRRVMIIAGRGPALWLWLGNLAMWQLYALEKFYDRFGSLSAEERYLEFTRKIEQRRLLSSRALHTLIPLKYIAQYLGVTQSTLSRLRRKHMRR